MDKHFMKNIEFEKALDLKDLVAYGQGQVVSRTLAQNNAVSITLFAFDTGEEISSHKSGGDAMITILEGKANITIGEGNHNLSEGQSIVMPAGIPHAVAADGPFKMLLVVVFPK
jgi:quercetin dioxygenase-like cupin family protein